VNCFAHHSGSTWCTYPMAVGPGYRGGGHRPHAAFLPSARPRRQSPPNEVAARSNECLVASKLSLVVFWMSLIVSDGRFAMSTMWIDFCAYIRPPVDSTVFFGRYASSARCHSQSANYNFGRSAVIIQKMVRCSMRLRCELRCLSGASSPKMSRPDSLGGALSIRS
jgi:hypothetical protein